MTTKKPDRFPSDFDQSILDQIFSGDTPQESSLRTEMDLFSQSSITLTMPTQSQLLSLRYFHRLVELNLKCDGDIDLTPLKALLTLSRLTISGANLENMDFLGENSKLTHLDISNTSLVDLSALSSLKQLKSLRLRKCEIDDLRFLADFSQLETLNLNENNIEELSPLTHMISLKVLDIDGNDVFDLGALAPLSKNKPSMRA